MAIRVTTIDTAVGPAVTVAADSAPLAGERDVVDLLGYCAAARTHRVLLPAAGLHPDFFDLSTGLAGAVLLKFSTYRVRAAFVVDPATVASERFHELMRESNRCGPLRFFDATAAALDWLAAG